MRTLPGVLATLAALALGSTARAAPPRRGIELAPCQLSPPGFGAQRVAARCGTLDVPLVEPAPGEAVPAGARTLTLRVAVAGAEGSPAPDAVFVLAGGPGQAATEVYPQLAKAFQRIQRKRDVVLVDQRGTGGSGKLECPEVPQPAVGRPLSPEEQRRVVGACAAALAKRTDLDAYDTVTFVRDLERVRAALGYEKVDLVGFSYGTRAAQVYAREFPDRVRALVLDGVAPMSMKIGDTFEPDGQAAIEKLVGRCAAEPGCKARFPDLRKDVEGLLARLAAAPVKVEVRDALTNEPKPRSFGADELRQVLFSFAYTGETVALLPPLVHAAAGGDFVPLAGAVQIVSGDIETTIARAMQLSVICKEDIPFYEKAPPAGGGWFGARVRDQFLNLCASWPVKPVDDAVFRRTVKIQAPALLMSGEADPVTPPRWAELAAQDLPRAKHLVLPGQGHGVFFRGCMPRVAAAFLEAGTADGLDTGCLERVRAAPPFLDAQGGSP
ncbi:MAG: alpha/beta hydrolase [Anaeromyxobacteraceae bacterium]